MRTYRKNSDGFAIVIQQKHYIVKADSIKQKCFDISLEIKNTSDKAIKIWLMTCSWEDNFIVNNNYIFIRGHECDNNFPTLVEFKPGESKVFTNTLVKPIKFDYTCENCIYVPHVETTKIGVKIIDYISVHSLNVINYISAMEDKSKWKIVWSNPLYLLAGNELSPKPIEIAISQGNMKY